MPETMEEPKQDTIKVEISDGVATVALNRPSVLNALNSEMVWAMRDALSDLRAKPEVRVLVIKGEGRGFCAGADLKDPIMADADPGIGSPRVGELIDVPGLRRVGVAGFGCGWLYVERDEAIDVVRLLADPQDLGGALGLADR